MTVRIAAGLMLLFEFVVAGGPAGAADVTAKDWRGDARFLAQAVDSIHPHLDRRRTWPRIDSAATAIEAKLADLHPHQAVAEFARLLALLQDGHSRLEQLRFASHDKAILQPIAAPGFETAYPVEFEVFSDGLRIVRAKRAHARWLGAKVTAIGGRPVAEAVAAFAPFISADNEMGTLRVLPALLRSSGYHAAAGLAPAPGASLRLALVDASGRARQVALPAEPPDSTAEWVEADAGVKAPLPLTRRLTGAFAFEVRDDSLRTVFVRIRQIVDPPGGESMAGFVARVFARVDSIDSRRLILDLRRNGGGNNYLNQPLVHALIQRATRYPTGRLFVLVDRGTFSAAMSLAAALERETRALFGGEPTGGAPNAPGDPGRVRLPASGLVARISTVQWDGSDPRDTRPAIFPDLPVSLTWADWLARRDLALDAIEGYRPSADATERPPNTRWGSRAQQQGRFPAVAW